MRFFPSTIQRKLLLLLLAVGLVPAVLAVLHIHWGTVVGLDTMLGGVLQEHADDTAAALDESLAFHLDAAEELRRQEEVSPGSVAAGKAVEPFDEIRTIDAAGQPETSASQGSSSEYLIPAAVRSRTALKGVFLDEVPRPGGTGSRLLFFAPLKGESRRLLVAVAETSRVVQRAMALSSRGQSVSIASNRGVTIGGEEVPAPLLAVVRRRIAETPLSGWISTPQGESSRFLVGYASPRLLRSRRNEGLTSVDWSVLSRMNVADVTVLSRFLLWRSLLFALVLMPLLGVLSYWLAHRFLRPLGELRTQADRLAGGDLGARVSITTGDELEALGRSFNDMARGLDFSQAALEEQIRIAEAKARQLALVHNITGAIIAAFDLPRLFQTVHEQLGALVPHDALTAVIFEPETHGASILDVHERIFSTEEEILVRDYCEQRLTRVEAARILDPGHGGGALPPAGRPEPDAPVRAEFQQICLLPLRAEPGLIGTLVLARHAQRRWNETELRMLVQVGQVLAIAVEHIRLYERTRGFAAELEVKVAERASQLEKAQDKLIQAERFAATGRLAASIAHEINNPLGIIKNYLRILRDRSPNLEQSAGEALRVVNEELDRIARIVRNLLYFYRPSTLREAELDLNEEVRVLLPLMEGGFRRKRIRVETKLEPHLPRPLLAPDHIRQVLLNLLKNAEDAVEADGLIEVETLKEERPGERDLLVLRVRDNGCGIPPENLPHIFEPFFTSKQDGQGTGLGLSVTYGIVRNLRGTLDVESAPGVGTTVTVRIPVSNSAIAVSAD